MVEARLKASIAKRKAGRTQTPVIAAVQNAEPASALPANMTAEVTASQAARLGSPGLPDGVRSPSAVPAVEAVPVITKEEMNTSGRYGTLLPEAQVKDSDLDGRSPNGASPNTAASNSALNAAKDREASNVHVLPVPLGSHQRDQYVNFVYYREETISRFLGHDPATPEDTAAAEQFLDELRDIAMHPDLANDETASQQSSPERQAQWDVDISSKFRFLRDFLGHLQLMNTAINVTIAAKGYKLPAMICTFLIGLHVPYIRLAEPDVEQDEEVISKIKLSVLDLDLDIEQVPPADVVIAMDGSVDYKDRLLQAARYHADQDRWAPLIKLAVPNTVEHIERCLLPSMTAAYRLRVLVKNAKRLRYTVGKTEEDYAPANELAETVVGMVAEGTTTEWPFAELGHIEDLDSQTDTDPEPESNGSIKQHDDLSASGTKRPLELDMDIASNDNAKRSRTQPSGDGIQIPATINPHDVDITHISDSLEKGTQSALDMLSTGPIGVERRPQDVLSEVQDRLEENVKALEDLQYRHEDQRSVLFKTRQELADAMAVAQTAMQRKTHFENQNVDLRAERSTLKQQLEEANKKLLDHSNPERREFESLRLQLEAALAAQAKAEKRADATTKDLEWTREMYQDSSSKARELAEQNTEMETKLAHAQALAAGEIARARSISQQGHNKLLEKENEKFKLILEDREAGLKFRDEEIARLKEAGRGRMGTRGTSVPRSPRVGSPLKGRASRQTSPATGDARNRGSHLNPMRNG
jgi:hypothetical protein